MKHQILIVDLQIKVNPPKSEFTDNSYDKKVHDKKTAFKKIFKAVREMKYRFMDMCD